MTRLLIASIVALGIFAVLRIIGMLAEPVECVAPVKAKASKRVTA